MSTAATEKPQEIALVQPTLQALSAKQLLDRVNLIKEVKSKVMQKGVHYGTIPGCGPKDTLFKAGADTLCMTFQLVPEYEVTTKDLEGGHREHTVKCKLSTVSGQLIAEGVGSCSTMESKYRYFKDDDGARIERQDIADVYNNTLKIGKKRAYVDATITATGSSDLFTQDIEDFKDEDKTLRRQAPSQSSDVPTSDARPTEMMDRHENGDEEWRGTVERVEPLSGRSQKTGRPWKMFVVYLSGGFKASTFEKEIGHAAAQLTNKLAAISVTPGKKEGTWNLLGIQPAVIENNDYEPGDESLESPHGGDE